MSGLAQAVLHQATLQHGTAPSHAAGERQGMLQGNHGNGDTSSGVVLHANLQATMSVLQARPQSQSFCSLTCSAHSVCPERVNLHQPYN